MCVRSVGEDFGCIEIKTHEVELILKKSVLDFTDENSQSRTCKECEKKRF